MPLLEAFLALALTMLALSTMATVGVEIANRILHLRGKDMKRMLTIFYEKELQQVVNAHFNLTVLKGITDKRDEVVGELMSNPLVADETKWRWSWIRDLTNLSTENMVKRLPKTAVGVAYAAQTAADRDTLLDNTIAKYEQYGKAASDLFKRRSQVVSIVAGIVVAFSLNVDALSMFDTYMRDPAARQAVIANADAITASSEKVNDKITQQSASKPGPFAGDEQMSQIVRDSQKNQEEQDKRNKTGSAAPQEKSDLEEVQSDLAMMMKLATDMKNDTGAPLGYRKSVPPATIFWPEATTSDQPDAADGQPSETKEVDREKTPTGMAKIELDGWEKSDLLIWFLRVFGSGLLIGLGGPFWYNIVRSLMSMVGGGRPATPPPPAAPQGAVAAEGVPPDPNADLKKTFETMQHAEQLMNPTGGAGAGTGDVGIGDTGTGDTGTGDTGTGDTGTGDTGTGDTGGAGTGTG